VKGAFCRSVPPDGLALGRAAIHCWFFHQTRPLPKKPISMFMLFAAPFIVLRALFRTPTALALENLALRQQLAALKQKPNRPRLRKSDRIFWVWLSKLWSDWRGSLIIVQPETVVRWHRQGFRLYWRWKSRPRSPGRPKVDAEIRRLIRRMCRENPLWGVPRILSELKYLGHDVAEATVRKYMLRHRKPPSPTWRTFLRNHAPEIAAIDFFTVPSATFRILFCFVVVSHNRRKILHFNVTDHPNAFWTATQITEAFPWNTAPRFLLRDRDGAYGRYFSNRVRNMGIEEVLCAPRSPWQDPYAERLIGSIRRECLDHVIVLGERHLRRILASYVEYYNHSRLHLSLNRDAPIPRKAGANASGQVIAIPQVGGLHHRYERCA